MSKTKKTEVKANTRKTEVHLTTVDSRHWGPGDDYEVVEIQVFDIEARRPVKVTIEEISDEEWKNYLETGKKPE